MVRPAQALVRLLILLLLYILRGIDGVKSNKKLSPLHECKEKENSKA